MRYLIQHPNTKRYWGAQGWGGRGQASIWPTWDTAVTHWKYELSHSQAEVVIEEDPGEVSGEGAAQQSSGSGGGSEEVEQEKEQAEGK